MKRELIYMSGKLIQNTII